MTSLSWGWGPGSSPSALHWLHKYPSAVCPECIYILLPLGKSGNTEKKRLCNSGSKKKGSKCSFKPSKKPFVSLQLIALEWNKIKKYTNKARIEEVFSSASPTAVHLAGNKWQCEAQNLTRWPAWPFGRRSVQPACPSSSACWNPKGGILTSSKVIFSARVYTGIKWEGRCKKKKAFAQCSTVQRPL